MTIRKESVVDVVESVAQDVRYATRALIRNGRLTALASLTLALGIGASASIFSVANAAFFAPYGIEAPERLLRIYGEDRARGTRRLNLSMPRFELFRGHQKSFSHLAAANYGGFTFAATEETILVSGASVTSDFFSAFGIEPVLGRFFAADEERDGRVAVLGRAFWQARFGGDPAVVGRSITLSGAVYTIIGIAPPLPSFWDADVWLASPFQVPGVSADLLQRGLSFLAVVGRTKPGVSNAQALADLDTLAGRYRELNGAAADAAWTVAAIPLRDDIVGTSRGAVLTLLGAVGLLMIVACANVANLLLVRFMSRRQEIGLRAALGASRRRIAQPFLIESLLVSGLAAGAGGLVAYWTLPLLVSLVGDNVAFADDIRLSLPVIAATGAMSLAAGLAIGAYPAWQGARVDVVASLGDAGRSVTGFARSHRLRTWIVGAQVAVSLMLLVGAGLLVTSYQRLRNQPAGFDADRVFSASINLPSSRYPTMAAQTQFYRRLTERLAEVPGVEQASLSQALPLTGPFTRVPYATAEGAIPPLNERALAPTHSVMPGYFSALRIPIVAGRDFDSRDTDQSPRVAIVTETTASALFGTARDALGRRIIMGSQGGGDLMEIVGIVRDVRTQTLAGYPEAEFYRPVTQRGRPAMGMTVRTTGDPRAFESTARRAVAEIDPALPLSGVTTLREVVDQSLASERLLFTLLGIFSVLAVTVAGVGIYGVVASFVGQRSSEVGLRFALGANRSQVLLLLVRQSLAPIAAGLAAGVAGTFWLGRYVQSVLFGVSAQDPLTLVISIGAVLLIAAIACGLPAARVTRVSPATALRGR